VNKIHLIGSSGFIGKAIQRQASSNELACWSHQSGASHHFDLLNPKTWHDLLADHPKLVILLSWPGLPNYHKSFHLIQNLPASLQLVEKLIESGIERIVVAGTCYEYGLQNGCLGEDLTTDPVNHYAIAKNAFRKSLSLLCNASGIRWCWLRVFYPYGDGQNPQSILPSLQRAIEAGDSSFGMSSGRQIRDFVSVEEVARQLLLLAKHPEAIGIYNGGSGVPRSLREIAEQRIKEEAAQIKLDLGVYPDRLDEPLAFWAKMERLRNLVSDGRDYHVG
jgi:nucleoside-diphosphate-sugar epimerase